MLSSIVDPRGEVERLIKIIQESDLEVLNSLSQEDNSFLGKIMLKLLSEYSKFSDKEVYYLRDIKDRTL